MCWLWCGGSDEARGGHWVLTKHLLWRNPLGLVIQSGVSVETRRGAGAWNYSPSSFRTCRMNRCTDWSSYRCFVKLKEIIFFFCKALDIGFLLYCWHSYCPGWQGRIRGVQDYYVVYQKVKIWLIERRRSAVLPTDRQCDGRGGKFVYRNYLK